MNLPSLAWKHMKQNHIVPFTSTMAILDQLTTSWPEVVVKRYCGKYNQND